MTRFFERPGPRWFNIPAHRPFAEDLARGLYEALADDGARQSRLPGPGLPHNGGDFAGRNGEVRAAHRLFDAAPAAIGDGQVGYFKQLMCGHDGVLSCSDS